MFKMKCTKCGAFVDEKDRFCGNCGNEVESKEQVALVKAVANETYSTYNGKRVSEQIGKTRVHYGMATHSEEVIKALTVFLTSNGYNPKVTENGRETVIKVEQINIFKYLFGLNKSAIIRISISGDNLVTSVGEPQWIDKLIGVGLGLFFFYFIWLFWSIVLFGTYQQWSLLKMIDNEIDAFLISRR